MPKGTMANWVAAKRGTDPTALPGSRSEDKLYSEIGKLKMQVDWLKKKLGE